MFFQDQSDTMQMNRSRRSGTYGVLLSVRRANISKLTVRCISAAPSLLVSLHQSLISKYLSDGAKTKKHFRNMFDTGTERNQ